MSRRSRLITKPMGLYLMQVLDANGKTWFDPILKPLERLTYKIIGVRAGEEQDWRALHLGDAVVQPRGLRVHLRDFAAAKFSAAQSAGFWRVDAGPRVQHRRSVSPPTRTGKATPENPPCRISRRWWRWRSTISRPPPPASPSRRRSCAASRGIRRGLLGNFWVDLVRITYYLLLPICVVFARVARVAGHDPKFQALHEGQAAGALHRSRCQKTDDKGQPVTTNVTVHGGRQIGRDQRARDGGPKSG